VDVNDLWRHSKWVEFMYQRLTLARDLLTTHGVIVTSVDDNEVFSLGLLMKRVFGENAFVATCVWQKRYSRENREAIGDAHEYLLVFSPNPELFKARRNMLPLGEKQRALYKNPDNDSRGPWQSVSLTAQGYRPNQMYEIVAPNGNRHRPPEGTCWKLIESEYQKLVADGRIYFGKDGAGVPRRKYFLSEAEGIVPWTWWPHEEVGHTDEARKEIQELLETQTAFNTPKPVRLIERLLAIACGPDDIVLDFFAGSGTTAHAVLKQNAADGGRRRFILVSNTEATAEQPDKNLCRDVCARRVRKVIEGYGETAGTGGDFTYLRTSRVGRGRLTDLRHEQVWTILQLIHGETVAPFQPAARWQWAGNDEQALLYVPQFVRADAPALRKQVRQSGAVILYSWQSELIKQHVRAGHVQFEHLPAAFSRRFGLKG